MKRLVLFAIALVLAACGNKGPLVMPSPPPADVPAVAPAPAQPVEPPAADEPAKTESGTPAR